MFVHDPGGLGYRIDALWAYLAVHDHDGDEGVVAVNINGALMPLVGADEERVRALRPHAENAARASGRAVRLVRFDRRVDVEVIEP